jgi:hypothetical protein
VLGRVPLDGEPHVARGLFGLGVEAPCFLGQLLAKALGVGAGRAVEFGRLPRVLADLLCRPLGRLRGCR